jgi:hypothetical protein
MPTYASSHCVLTSYGDMYRMARFPTAETRNAGFINSMELRPLVAKPLDTNPKVP